MKRVVITGGTSGMGKEAVKIFLDNGYSIVFTGRDEDKGNAFSKELSNDKAYFFKADVSKEDDIKKLFDFTNKTLGGCDILVNNAGIFEGGHLHETTNESWDRLFNVNVKGIYFTTKYFVPEMIERKYGVIVNTSSISGMLGEYNMAAYCAAKGALCNLTRAMALDYADKGIRVNAVCPGATETPMFLTGNNEEVINAFKNVFPSRRIGKAKEVAEAIYFLATDKASFINGVNIPVAGGIMAHTGQPRQDKEE